MKDILLRRAFLIALCSNAVASPLDPPADHPSGLGDVQWGASIADAKKTMLKRPGISLLSETSAKLVFKGGTFAEQEVDEWQLSFQSGRFTEGVIRLKPADALREYEAMRKVIAAKYHKQGREERENARHRATYWDFSSGNGKWGIACDVQAPAAITLRYKDKSSAAVPAKGAAKDF